jgi:predicted esterase
MENMSNISKLMISVALMSQLISVVFAQDKALITVPRYDDADEFLPSAEKRNTDRVKLVLKQQPGEETFTAISGRRVSIKIIAKMPDDSKAGVVLFVGGNSVLSMGADDKLERSFNFTSRSREYYWPHGFATFLVDAPSDHLDKEGLTPQFRNTPEFAEDIKAVIALISAKFKKPIYAVGHSNGAVATAALAAMPELPILSYTLVSPAHTQWPGMDLVAKAKYTKPVFIVENTRDECKYSSAGSIVGLAKSINSPSVVVSWVDGGKAPIGGPCGPFGFHSFFGAEQAAVEAIVKNLN